MKSKIAIAILLFLLPLSVMQAQNAHFWDGIEAFDGPTDDNPVLASQLDFYFDKMVAPLPDSITLEITRLIDRTSGNTDLRDFILWHLLEKYRNPEYMGQDQVFVWLYDEYFSQLEIKDLHETNLAMIQEKAERFRRLALFNIAPDFRIGDSINLHSVESEYIVLFFFDSGCDVCLQDKMELDSVCASHPEITVLAIDLGSEETRVNNVFELYDIESKPLIYVLNRDKRIIAKKIQAKQIELVVNNVE
jgi:hypothetical protein